MRLLPGAGLDGAIRLLNTLAQNAYGAASPPGISHPVELQDAYVRWAVECERQLVGVISREDVDRFFGNPRHRDICAMPPGNQLRTMVSGEIDAKAKELRDLAAELTRARQRMARATGYSTVIDSNLLLECKRLDQIKWAEVIGQPQARVMVPLRVVEELDAKKIDPKDRLRETARSVLPWLERLFDNVHDCGPVPLGDPDKSTIEIILADRPRYRPSDADEEVLDVYNEVRVLSGHSATLVTMDHAMRLRARAEGAHVVVMDRAKYGRWPGTEAAVGTEPGPD